MAKKFETLRNKMPQERRDRIEQRVHEALAEMPLAELRQARKFTQNQIAELLKISQASVSKMEGQADLLNDDPYANYEFTGSANQALCQTINCR